MLNLQLLIHFHLKEVLLVIIPLILCSKIYAVIASLLKLIETQIKRTSKWKILSKGDSMEKKGLLTAKMVWNIHFYFHIISFSFQVWHFLQAMTVLWQSSPTIANKRKPLKQKCAKNRCRQVVKRCRSIAHQSWAKHNLRATHLTMAETLTGSIHEKFGG